METTQWKQHLRTVSTAGWGGMLAVHMNSRESVSWGSTPGDIQWLGSVNNQHIQRPLVTSPFLGSTTIYLHINTGRDELNSNTEDSMFSVGVTDSWAFSIENPQSWETLPSERIPPLGWKPAPSPAARLPKVTLKPQIHALPLNQSHDMQSAYSLGLLEL